MFFAIRQSFGDDFKFTMYQGDVGLPVQDANFQDMFPADKPVVLNFWAGLCPPCRAEMPGFQRVYDEFGDRITLLGLDVGPFMNLGSHGDARNLLSELNITYPTGFAHSRDPVAQFGVTAMPTTVFFTPDGKVFRTTIGFIDESSLERHIQSLITASATSS
jgi:thiol-disulfide isomerase/thioredoxin